MASETPTIEPSDISPISIVDEMKTSYLDYAMSVIVARALPDVRDGLKPVHRRILHSMNESGYDWNKPYRKSARVVGDGTRRLHVFAVPVVAAFVRRIEDAAVHGFQPVAHVGKRARHDHAHGVIEVGALHLLDDGNRLDVGGPVGAVDGGQISQNESLSKALESSAFYIGKPA